MKRGLLSWLLCLFCSAAATAQGACDAEIKLLLDPAQVQSVVKALDARVPTEGKIYLFDTEGHDLFSQGVILRARKGSVTGDLMVKVRVPADRTITVRGLGTDYKCEIDRTGETAVRSYSVRTKLEGEPPTSGKDFQRLLSPAQKRLLEEAHVSPDWKRVHKAAEIDSTVWKIRGEAGLTKLTLELWHWRSNQLLELSTKAADDDPSIVVEMRKLATGKGLSLAATQSQKTGLALRTAE